MTRTRTLAFVAFLTVIVAANALTAAFGLVEWLGLTATGGTWVAGLTFVARDTLQDTGGRRWVSFAILAGASISAILSPQLALASAAAFLLSELADFAVYTPLLNSGRTRAAIASNLVGSIVDTAVFLAIAGYPIAGAPTQVAIKFATTTIVVLTVRVAGAVLRQPDRV